MSMPGSGGVDLLGATKAIMTIIQMEDDGVRQKVIRLHDFFWDRVITTVIVLIFGVTSVQAIISFFNNGGLQCWTAENYTIAINQYINQLCRKDVPNYAKYFSISLYAEVALLSGLHIFWNQVWSGRIENFKSTISSMSLNRNTTTGHFEPSDYDAVRYLERNLESTALTWTYVLKIGGQIAVSAVGIWFLVFHPDLGFSSELMLTFECNNATLFEGQWPLAEASTNCALTELSNLQILRWFNFATLVIIIFANVVGTYFLAYSIYFYHTLDYKRVARFILYTGLRRDHYPEYHYKSGCNRKYEMCSNGCTHSCSFLVFSLCWWCKTTKCLGDSCCCPCAEENFTRGLIPFDMSFLIVRLLGTNTKMGEALLDVLIDNRLNYLIKNECCRVARVLKNNDDNLDGKEDTKRSSLGKYITEFAAQNSKLNCILITTDNESLAYQVDSYDVFSKVVCINFNSVISMSKESENQNLMFCHGKPLIYRIPSQMWSVDETMNKELKSPWYEIVEKAMKYLDENSEAHDTIIVLAPLSDEVYIRQGDLHNTMQRVISLLHHINGSLQHQLYLLSVIPKSIANKADVSSEFCWGKDDDHQLFLELINSECRSSSYTWEYYEDKKLSHQGSCKFEPFRLKVKGVKYSLRVYVRKRNSKTQN